MADVAHLSGLLLKGEELLDGTLYVALELSQPERLVFWTHDIATFARS
jgi:hypothetical protein